MNSNHRSPYTWRQAKSLLAVASSAGALAAGFINSSPAEAAPQRQPLCTKASIAREQRVVDRMADNSKPIHFYRGSLALRSVVGGIGEPIVAYCGTPKDTQGRGKLTSGSYLLGYLTNHYNGKADVHFLAYNPRTMELRADTPASGNQASASSAHNLAEAVFPSAHSSPGAVQLGSPESPAGKPLLDPHGEPLSVGLLAIQ